MQHRSLARGSDAARAERETLGYWRVPQLLWERTLSA
jgi:hypothetical protein